jgi:hypothetical protein
VCCDKKRSSAGDGWLPPRGGLLVKVADFKLEGATDGRREELNCVAWHFLLDEQRPSFRNRFSHPTRIPKLIDNQRTADADVRVCAFVSIHSLRGCCPLLHSRNSYIRSAPHRRGEPSPGQRRAQLKAEAYDAVIVLATVLWYAGGEAELDPQFSSKAAYVM